MNRIKPSEEKPWLKYYSDKSINYSIPNATAYQHLYNENKDYKSDIAIEFYGKRINYSCLFENIDATAKSLASYGVKPGDVVTICSITIPEVIYLFYALNRIGAIANMIDPRINTDRLSEIITNTRTELFFCLDLIYDKVSGHIDLSTIKNTVLLSVFDSMPIPLRVLGKIKTHTKVKSEFKWKRFISVASESYEEKPYEKNYPAAIVYTGGTTGVPKGAIISNDNCNAMATSYQYSIPPESKRGQTILDIMPPFIAYGLVTGIHMPLSLGVRLIIIPKFNPQEFPSLLKKYKPNHTLGVPSHYNVFLEKSDELQGVDLSFWVNPAVGGDAMNSMLEKKLNIFLKDHNCKSIMTKGYGMTELSGTAISSSIDFCKLESVGIPFSKNVVGIFKPGTSDELTYNEIGEVCIQAPTMFLGYYNNKEEEDKVKLTHDDGSVWIHSQDYGYIDEDGFVYIKGRIKRTLVRPDGHNNYPMEMESVLNEYEGVQQSAVVGFEAERYGNGTLPVAFIVCGGDNSIVSEKDLMSYCYHMLPKRDVPCGYFIVDNLPLTRVGKIDYQALQDHLNEIVRDSDIVENIYKNYKDTLVIDLGYRVRNRMGKGVDE